jgi:large subunit ribosomal protein L21
MNTYAIIQLAGKQYKVEEGETLTVNKLDEAPDKEFTITDVLLIGSDKARVVGTPLVEKASVTLKVVSNQKGDKIRVGKYRNKSRYRVVRGHRQSESTVAVVKITQ